MVAQHGAVEELGVGAVGAVPGVAAVSPGQLEGEGGEEVVERPGNDDVVVEADVDGDEDYSIADSCGEGGRQGSGTPFPRPSPTATSPEEPAPTTTAPPGPSAPPSQQQMVRASPLCPGNPPALCLGALSCHWSPLAHSSGRADVPGPECPQAGARVYLLEGVETPEYEHPRSHPSWAE